MKPYYFIFDSDMRTNHAHHSLNLFNYYVTVVAISREEAIKIFKKEFASRYLDGVYYEDCLDENEFDEALHPDGEYKEYKQTFNSVAKQIN